MAAGTPLGDSGRLIYEDQNQGKAIKCRTAYGLEFEVEEDRVFEAFQSANLVLHFQGSGDNFVAAIEMLTNRGMSVVEGSNVTTGAGICFDIRCSTVPENIHQLPPFFSVQPAGALKEMVESIESHQLKIGAEKNEAIDEKKRKAQLILDDPSSDSSGLIIELTAANSKMLNGDETKAVNEMVGTIYDLYGIRINLNSLKNKKSNVEEVSNEIDTKMEILGGDFARILEFACSKTPFYPGSQYYETIKQMQTIGMIEYPFLPGEILNLRLPVELRHIDWHSIFGNNAYSSAHSVTDFMFKPNSIASIIDMVEMNAPSFPHYLEGKAAQFSLYRIEAMQLAVAAYMEYQYLNIGDKNNADFWKEVKKGFIQAHANSSEFNGFDFRQLKAE